MNSDAIDVLVSVLDSERTCALATPTDTWPIHTAFLNYSYRLTPIEFFLSTDLNTLKCSQLRESGEVPAALAVGSSEQVMITAQVHGTLRFAEGRTDFDDIKLEYLKRNPFSQELAELESTRFLWLSPTWIRITDFNHDTPKEYLPLD